MRRSARIITVTAGLAGLGAAAGVAIALVGLALVALVTGLRTGHVSLALQAMSEPMILAFLLPKGALLGALTGPPVAWTLLRRVRIGRAVVGVALGALIGALTGDLALSALSWGKATAIPFGWLWCALLGVLIAALLLRRASSPDDAAVPPRVAASESSQLASAPGWRHDPAEISTGRTHHHAHTARG